MSEKNSKVAVNIALIPDHESRNRCFSLSNDLEENGEDGLLSIGKTTPHITLWMGAIMEEDLDHIRNWIKSVELKVILHHPRISYHGSGRTGTPVIHILFDEGDLISALHEKVHSLVEPFMKKDVDSAEFSDGSVHSSTLNYMRSFHEEHSLSKFTPHITIGYGMAEYRFGSENLLADRIGLFQMGDSCTCVREL